MLNTLLCLNVRLAVLWTAITRYVLTCQSLSCPELCTFQSFWLRQHLGINILLIESTHSCELLLSRPLEQMWWCVVSAGLTELSNSHIEGILPKGPYLPCVSMAGRALLAGYHWYPKHSWTAVRRKLCFTVSHDITVTSCGRQLDTLFNSLFRLTPGTSSKHHNWPYMRGLKMFWNSVLIIFCMICLVHDACFRNSNVSYTKFITIV